MTARAHPEGGRAVDPCPALRVPAASRDLTFLRWLVELQPQAGGEPHAQPAEPHLQRPFERAVGLTLAEFGATDA